MKILMTAATLSALALAGVLIYRLFDDDRRDALRWRELCRGEVAQISARAIDGGELPALRCVSIDADAWRECESASCRSEVLRERR